MIPNATNQIAFRQSSKPSMIIDSDQQYITPDTFDCTVYNNRIFIEEQIFQTYPPLRRRKGTPLNVS